LLDANDNILNDNNFDDCCNVAFGIHEYIDIPGVKYDHKIGIMGLQVCITLQRPGFRIKRRRLKAKKISRRHAINKKDAVEFMQKNFSVKIGEEE